MVNRGIITLQVFVDRVYRTTVMRKTITFVSSSEVKRLVDELPIEEIEKLLTEELNGLPLESRARIINNIIPSVSPEIIFDQLTKLYKVGNVKA